MKYAKEQPAAPYTLNLCTVLVYQIINYDYTYTIEQEYEAIVIYLKPNELAFLNKDAKEDR